MVGNRTVHLNPEEAQTYLHLGIIVAHAGHRDIAHNVRQQLARGERDLTGLNIGAWFYGRAFNDEELLELFHFRNSLLHSMTIVSPDGSVKIFDKINGEFTYTSEQIQQYATRFYNLRFDQRVTTTIKVKSGCLCGATFLQPEENELCEEHIKVCQVYLERLSDKQRELETPNDAAE